MSACFDTDQLADLYAMLGPDASDRLDHLGRCASCRAELATMGALHIAFVNPSGAVDEQALASVRAAVRREAQAERAKAPRQRLWGAVLESVFAGMTALALAFSNGVGSGFGRVILVSVVCATVVLVTGRKRREDRLSRPAY